MKKICLLLCTVMMTVCAVFSVDISQANATSVQDLVGRYRIVSGSGSGSEITIRMKDGELYGTIDKVRGVAGDGKSMSQKWSAGACFLEGTYVQNGYLHGSVLEWTGLYYERVIGVYDNGTVLKTFASESGAKKGYDVDVIAELQRM